MGYTAEQRELLARARAACADGTIDLALYSAAIAIMRQGRYAALQAAQRPAKAKGQAKRLKAAKGAPAPQALLDQTTQEPSR